MGSEMCIRDRVHPEGQERTRERQVGVVRRDEHDRPGGMFLRHPCLLYTSDAADERSSVDLGGRRIIKKKNIQK